MEVLPGSGFDESTGIYHSKLPSVVLPENLWLGVAEHILSKNSDHRRRGKTAMVDALTGQKMTYEELEERVAELAAVLTDLGVAKGNVVLILAPNCVNYAIIVLATMLLGGIVTATNPAYKGHELDKQLQNSHVSLIFSTVGIVKKLWPQSSYLSQRPTVLIGGGDETSTVMMGRLFPFMSHLMNLMKNSRRRVVSGHVSQGDTALVLYSSGTTGLSKGVVISHRNLIAFTTIYNANPTSGYLEDDVYACIAPQFHIYGLAVLTLAQLARGITIVILPKYTITRLLEAVHNYRITHLPLVPPIVLQLTNQTLETLSKYDLRSLTQISCGAAPLHKSTMQRCCKMFPGVTLQQGYGMTESTAVGATCPIDYKPEYFGSVGLLAINTQAKVVDVDHKISLPPYGRGELWLRSAGNMKGYLNNPKATAEALDSQGWLHTGDVVYFNDEGYLFVVDRIKELIKFKGFQVAPAELEALLMAHPDIVEAAVIPYPDEMAGEVPMAFIVKKLGASLTEEDVMKYIEGKVASFKKVRKVAFIEALPKLPSGKVLRRVLHQNAKSGLGNPQTSSKL